MAGLLIRYSRKSGTEPTYSRPAAYNGKRTRSCATLLGMKIIWRLFAVLVFSTMIVAPTFISSAPNPAGDSRHLAFVGTYTGKTGSKGIYAFDFDSSTGTLTLKGVAAETPSPSWVAIHPSGKFAYAANEDGKQSTITAFSVDAKSAKLTQLNQLSALGQDPCYLSFDKTGKYLFAANYSSGNVVVFPIQADGKLGEHTANVTNAGKLGPNKQRQEAPHAHWVQVSPDNRFVFVADLGLDAVMSYKFDAAKGTLTPNDPPLESLAAGAGPRHMTFTPNGKFVYVVSELNNTVTAFSYNGDKGTFHEFQIISTLPADFSGRNDDAEIAVHPNGKWLFASNRGHDTIAVFSIDPKTGNLTRVGDFPTAGKEPRHFTVDPTGKYVLAENQNSNSIVVFRIDPTGSLTKVSEVTNIASPVCLTFLH
jgi:6-phosphogluconolactonase